MKFLVDFHDDAPQVDVDAYLASFTSSTLISPSTRVYLVESETTPALDTIVENVVEDTVISSQLLQVDEVIVQLASNSTLTVDNNDAGRWWMLATASNIDTQASETLIPRKGNNATVYVVDSGINVSHAEFQGKSVSNLFAFDNNFTDTRGHGTAMASVIVGATTGITEAEVKSVKIFDDNTPTYVSDMVAAFEAILDDMLLNPARCHAVNLSWSIPKNAYIESKIQNLINAGAVVVVSAGNSGMEIVDVTPASMSDVIVVGAYTEDFEPANFSNFSSALSLTPGMTNHGDIDVWAPGVNVTCASHLDNSSLVTVAGTSIAAAIMSASLAYNSDNLRTAIGVEQLKDSFIPGDFSLHWFTMSRRGNNLLTFSGVYAGEKNIVATIANAPLMLETSTPYTRKAYVFRDADTAVFLARSSTVSSISIDMDLPDGLSLSNGWLIGRALNVADPTQAVTLPTYLVTVTFVDSTVKTFPLKITVAPEGTDPTQAGREALVITLNDACGTGATCAGFVCPGVDNCVSCNGDPKVGGSCICAPTEVCV